MGSSNLNRDTLAGWLLLGALFIVSPNSYASQESVDETTQSALALDVNLERGRKLYATQCVSCHGRSGFGDASRSIPALAGQRFAYIVRQLANFSGEERENDMMHHVVSRQKVRLAQSWADLAGYLSRMPSNPATEIGNGTHLALGRGIFHESGDEDGLVPALKGQHYSYLLGQLRQLAADRRHNVDEDLQRFLRSFDEADMEGIADYLSRQHHSSKSHQRMRENGTVID
jgi:cytochrome c553